jgi:hypothetical protein
MSNNKQTTEKQTIDLTPSWVGILLPILEVYKQSVRKLAFARSENKHAKESLTTIETELKSMANVADRYVALDKSGILDDNVIHIAQIYGKNLCDDLLNWLKHKAAFKDTDRTLNEFIVPVSVLTHAVDNFERYKDKTAFNEVVNLWANFKDKNIQHLHITFA